VVVCEVEAASYQVCVFFDIFSFCMFAGHSDSPRDSGNGLTDYETLFMYFLLPTVLTMSAHTDRNA
jgi:hypothetical protein